MGARAAAYVGKRRTGNAAQLEAVQRFAMQQEFPGLLHVLFSPYVRAENS